MGRGRQVLTFDPIAQPSGSFNAQLPRGCGTVRIKNDSLVDLIFSINNFTSLATEVAPGATVDIQGEPPYNQIYWATQYKLTSNSKTIASIVTVIAYDPGETPPDVAAALPRHFNEINSGFRAGFVQNVAAANNWMAISVFNPTNSTTNGTFYWSIFTQDGSTFLSPRLTRMISDPALSGVTVSAINRNLFNPGGSQMSVTAQVNLAGEVFGQGYLNIARVGNNSYFFILYPDQVIATPGTGVMMIVQVPATTTQVQMELLWTETLL